MLCLALLALGRQLQQLQLQQAASDSPFQLLQILSVTFTQVCATCITESDQIQHSCVKILVPPLWSSY